MIGGSSDRRKGGNGVVIRNGRDGGRSRKAGNGDRKGTSKCRIRFISEVKGGGMSGRFGRKPHVVVHLNVKGIFQRVRERREGVIKVPKIWGVHGSTRKESRRKGGEIFGMMAE